MPRLTKKQQREQQERWEREANILVISQLISAANLDEHSEIGRRARERLMNLANAIDPVEVKRQTDEIARIKFNMARAVSAFMLTDKERQKKYGTRQ